MSHRFYMSPVLLYPQQQPHFSISTLTLVQTLQLSHFPRRIFELVQVRVRPYALLLTCIVVTYKSPVPISQSQLGSIVISPVKKTPIPSTSLPSITYSSFRIYSKCQVWRLRVKKSRVSSSRNIIISSPISSISNSTGKRKLEERSTLDVFRPFRNDKALIERGFFLFIS